MIQPMRKNATVIGSDEWSHGDVPQPAEDVFPLRGALRRSRRCDRFVIVLRSARHLRLRHDALTCVFIVGMPGFEPGISGPPDRRPGPN